MEPQPLSLRRYILPLLFGLLFLSLLAFVFSGKKNLPNIGSNDDKNHIITKSDFVKFGTDDEFRKYLGSAQQTVAKDMPIAGGAPTDMRESQAPGAPGVQTGEVNTSGLPQQIPYRVSETNVQVIGIDEPDIVKTNGREIYYSQEGYMYPLMRGARPETTTNVELAFDRMMYPYNPPLQNTKIFSAFPPESLRQSAAIEKNGNLLYFQNTLVVLSQQGVYAYDVSDKQNPKTAWELTYKDGFAYSAARLMDGKLYIVAQKSVYAQTPCPMPLYTDREGASITIACTDVYYPTRPVSANTVYSVVKIDPKSGNRLDTISFVGGSAGTTVYMSRGALYVTYPFVKDQFELMSEFILQENTGLFPQSVVDRLAKIASYDISPYSKKHEIETVLSGFLATLDENEKLRLQNELANRFTDFVKRSQAGIFTTGIVRIGFDGVMQDFSIDAVGSVPGSLLNQFALDEYNGNLRVATTSDAQSLYMFGVQAPLQTTTSNGVYVLNAKTLARQGAVVDLGLTERIYSVRFMGNKGYLVTFRQIDPFYVIDLADPRNPKVAGELKIPGFSSYLHPLYENVIVGVGQEGGQVKLSLFDVSDSANPREIDKYLLSDSWSEVSTNHHAFLQDASHKIFFMPGGRGGYIFSYDGNRLSLKKTLAETGVKRAIYIDDYFYIIGEKGITVYNENSWDQIAHTSL